MKILFYGTFPTQSNGYAKVGNQITNYLASKDVDVYYFGITAYETTPIKRWVHPNIKLIDVYHNSPTRKAYGDDLIIPAIEQIQPDILFLYNDIIVLDQVLLKIKDVPKTFQIYTYIDLVYEFENLDRIYSIDKYTDKFFVFSDCWKINLRQMNINDDKIFILRHGFDKLTFFHKNQIEARKKIGLPLDDFIILNINRNTHRKALDITLSAFLRLIKKHPDDLKIRLYLTGNTEPTSYNLLEIIRVECIQLNLDYNKIIFHHILISNSHVLPDEDINDLYNSCDVGLNTCYGEGFGLCNLEHASVGKPQVMSKVGALCDIFKDGHCKLVEPKVQIYVPSTLDSTGGYLKVCSADDFADALDEYYLDRKKGVEDGMFYQEKNSKDYDWNIILEEFYTNHIGM
jgi:glycosyltransferase involved in cell wall biosynthesis